VATAVSGINRHDRDALYSQLVEVARRRTARADLQLDDRGQPLDAEALELGENVIIVDRGAADVPAPASAR
jgi:hypothetical protein